MKSKLNYLILMLTIVFLVGCTNTKSASVTEEDTDTQIVTTDAPSKNNEKEETVTTDVEEQKVEEPLEEPIVEEEQPQPKI